MSQIHYRDITLEQLVAKSELIVVARPADPAPRRASEGDDQAPDDETKKVRLRTVLHFAVSDVLKGDKAASGETIEANEAYWAERVMMQQVYEQRGIMRSPLFDRYPQGEALDEQDGLQVLFFTGRGGERQLACVGGRESMKSVPKVKKLLGG